MNKLHKKNLVTVLKTTNDKIRYLLEAFEIPERLESTYSQHSIFQYI